MFKHSATQKEASKSKIEIDVQQSPDEKFQDQNEYILTPQQKNSFKSMTTWPSASPILWEERDRLKMKNHIEKGSVTAWLKTTVEEIDKIG